MTDQNSLARSYQSDMMEDDDPLAELARIVSGQSARHKPAPVAARPVVQDVREHEIREHESREMAAEPQAQSWSGQHEYAEDGVFGGETRDDQATFAIDDAPYQSAPVEADSDAFDLESELMRELGGARDDAASPSSINDMLAELEGSLGEADEPATGFAAEPSPEPAPDPALELSLEDQLMAELGFGDDAAAEPRPLHQPVAQPANLHPQTAMAQPSGGWSRATPVAMDRAPRAAANQQPVAQTPVHGEDHGDGLDGDLESEFATMFASRPAADVQFMPTPDAVDDMAHSMAAGNGDFGHSESAYEPAVPGTDDLDRFADQFLGDRQAQDFEPQPASMEAQGDSLDDFNFDDAFAEEFSAGIAQASQQPAQQSTPQLTHPAPVHPQPAPSRSQTTFAQPAASPEPELPDLEDQFASAFEEELLLSDEAPVENAKTPVWKRFASGFSSRRKNRAADGDFENPDEIEDGYSAASDPGFAENELDYDPSLDEPEAPLLQTRRSNGFRIAGFALFGALVLGLGAVSYATFSGNEPAGEPVVIKADNEPVKVKPADPGGAEVANQDKAAYERVTGDFGAETTQEKLVSGTEDPVNIEDETTSVADADPAFDAKAEERLTPEPENAAITPVSAALEPRKVRTMAVLPDGTVVAPSAAPETTDGASLGGGSLQPIDGPVETAALADPAAPVVKEAAVEPAQKPAKLPGTPVATAKPQSTNDAPLQIAPAPKAADAPSQTASVQRSEWAVQVASQRSAEEANAAYANLKRKFPSILDGRQMAVQRAEIEGKGIFFRVRMQAESKEEAVNLCERLKGAGGSCFVTR